MGDGTEPLAMEDADWRYFCESATREIDADIDNALLRCAANSSLADAVLLAGYLNRGHLFETKINGRVTPIEDDAE